MMSKVYITIVLSFITERVICSFSGMISSRLIDRVHFPPIMMSCLILCTGFYGNERTERSLIDYPVQDKEADEDEKYKEELSRWKRTDTGKWAEHRGFFVLDFQI